MIATAFTAHRQTSRIAYNHPYPLKSHWPGAVRLTSKTRLTRVTEAVDDVVFLHLVLPDCTVVGKLLAAKVEAKLSVWRGTGRTHVSAEGDIFCLSRTSDRRS